jgi:hypothetical protein
MAAFLAGSLTSPKTTQLPADKAIRTPPIDG